MEHHIVHVSMMIYQFTASSLVRHNLTLWNSLSLSFNWRSFKLSGTFAGFVHTLKTELFDTAYSEHSTLSLPSRASVSLVTHDAVCVLIGSMIICLCCFTDL